MKNKKSLFIAIAESNLNKLIQNKIPKIEYDKYIFLYQSLECICENMKRKLDYIFCELQFSDDKLIELYKKGILIAPTVWLIDHGLVGKSWVSQEDYMMLKGFFKTATFEFTNFVVYKEDIVVAYKKTQHNQSIIYKKE